jgi:hypothetical protein
MTSRIQRHRRIWTTALAVGVLAAGALATSAGAGPANAAVASPAKDVITIDTTIATPAIRYWNSAGVEQTQQTLGNQSKGCGIKTAGASWLALGASMPNANPQPPVGYLVGSIGVAEKSASSAQSCGEVNSTGGERLTIGLGSKVATTALLDVEVKQNAVILATAKRNGTTVAYFELQSGGSVTADGSSRVSASLTPADVPHTVWACNLSADSGSDSKANDNCGWLISAIFDSVQLDAITGSFSVEGGGDGPVPGSRTGTGQIETVSYFTLGVPCTSANSTIQISGSTFATDGSTYTRYTSNADGTECLALPTTLSRQTDGDLELTKPSGQPAMQGVVTGQWLSDPETEAINTTEVNFVAGAPEANWVPMPWCPSALYDAAGNPRALTGISPIPDTAAGQLTTLGLEDQDFSVYDPAHQDADNDLFQYACILGRSTSYVVSSQQFKTTDAIFLLGDVLMRK